MKNPNCIRTFTGKNFNIFVPKLRLIDIRDIAHAESLITRFTGHTKKLYSVAQHSLIMEELAEPEYKLETLLHDGTEAFTNDVSTILKRKLPDYKAIENNLHHVIATKYSLFDPFPKEVKELDNEVFDMEWKYLMLKKEKQGKSRFPASKFKYMSPERAERFFLKRFEILYAERLLKIKNDKKFSMRSQITPLLKNTLPQSKTAQFIFENGC